MKFLRLVVGLMLAAIVGVLGVGVASATPPNDLIVGGFHDIQGGFFEEEGCLTKGANIEVRYYDYSLNGVPQHSELLFVHASIFDTCANQLVFAANSEYPRDPNIVVDEFTLPHDLMGGRIRLHGDLRDLDGDLVPVNVDLDVVPQHTPRAGVVGPDGCVNPDYICNRVIRDGGGYFTGSFEVNGTDFFTPWHPLPPEGGVIPNSAGLLDGNVTCRLPAGTDLHECTLLELP